MSAPAASLDPARAVAVGRRALSLGRLSTDAVLTVGIGALLAAISFAAGGGLELGSSTTVEMALTLGGGTLITAAILADDPRSPFGLAALALMLVLAVLTSVSVAWSVQPADTWLEASRTTAFAWAFAASIAAVRLAPRRWPGVLGGVLLGAVVVCGYGLATKVFPGALNPGEIYARLREPFGYWNAVGLTAALATPMCLWLGARRDGPPLLNALAYPALGLLELTLLLSYSRGALAALVVGLIVWFTTVALRLRSAAMLLTVAACLAPVVAWEFSQPALSQDRVDVALRSQAGHDLGLLIVVLVGVLYAAGLVVGFVSARRRPGPARRDQIGVALVAALALVPVGLGVGMATSSRGLGGSLSHTWDSLTDPNARLPPGDPSRLTAVGSVRARYWNEALQIFTHHPVLGVGAGGYDTARLRYRDDNVEVRHAHGYVVQTLSDLGIVGLLVSLALTGAWLAAAGRSARPWDWWPRWPLWLSRPFGGRRPASQWDRPPLSGERIGLLALLSSVTIFGVHSLVDWTWFVPGNACTALLAAGWLAGRGPLVPATDPRAVSTGRRGFAGPPDERGRIGALAGGARLRFAETVTAVRGAPGARRLLAAGAIVLTLIAAWSEWQPLRSAGEADRALTALGHQDLRGALSQARRAVAINPLSVEALFDLAAVQASAADLHGARATLGRAVRLQPANPQTWARLADFDFTRLANPRAALADLRPALYLDPRSFQVITQFLQILRSLGGTSAPAQPGQPLPSVAVPRGTPVTPPATTPPSRP